MNFYFTTQKYKFYQALVNSLESMNAHSKIFVYLISFLPVMFSGYESKTTGFVKFNNCSQFSNNFKNFEQSFLSNALKRLT